MADPPDPQARRQAILNIGAFLPGYPKTISGQAKAIQSVLAAKAAETDRTVRPKATSGLSLKGLMNRWIKNPEPKEICNVSFNELSQCDEPLDIMSCATPERYRLLDCEAAVSNRRIRILEFTDFPRIQYAALSYVWRGNSPSDCSLGIQEFSVLGAEDADPIGVDVLVDACAASLACGASHLWLDRLCIMQTSKKDKRWQIREMYRVYTFASICVVAPGGLRFLVPFSEETQWIHRSWTLQEVVAPPAVAILFAWTHGAGEAYTTSHGEHHYARIEEIAPGRSGMMGLQYMVGMCGVGHFEFTSDSADEGASPVFIEASLFGKLPTNLPQIGTLIDPDNFLLPNVAALSFAAENYLDTEEMRDFCIWQSALVRTSSRPVDMVFSIMGILGVMLDPSDFAVDDRLGATIALAREILRQGRSASWLGISVTLPPCPYLSTFPVFPKTSVAGQAMYDLPGGGQEPVTLAEAIYPNDIGMFPDLKGSMDENGYLSLDALAVMVLAASETALSAGSLYDDTTRPTQLRAMDGSTWIITDLGASQSVELTSSGENRSFAVMLGWYNGIPAVTEGNTIRAMLVTEHAEDKYHVRSYFLFSSEALRWVSTWKQHHFCVGGPERYSDAAKSIEST